jgi:hypothetical protein
VFTERYGLNVQLFPRKILAFKNVDNHTTNVESDSHYDCHNNVAGLASPLAVTLGDLYWGVWAWWHLAAWASSGSIRRKIRSNCGSLGTPTSYVIRTG